MADQFTTAEWEKINSTLAEDPGKFGLPVRRYGSAVLGSFNIRKLGTASNRNSHVWRFLAHICSHFDLIAVQEIMDNLSGLRRLLCELGPDFGVIISDITGAFPGNRGLAERLGFIYNKRIVERTEIATDITYDRTEILKTLALNRAAINPVMERYGVYLEERQKYDNGEIAEKPKKPSASKLRMPVFLSFIRQPCCVSFRIQGHPGTAPYEFMAVNAHLNYGDPNHDPIQEFTALMRWIVERAGQKGKAYYPDFILLGDLNLDFDDPVKDKARLENDIKGLNKVTNEGVSVNFPFLDQHPGCQDVFRTNARLTETFDQIGLFSRDPRFPTYLQNPSMGQSPVGPDYGVFNFTELFARALKGESFAALSNAQQSDFYQRFQYKVSDHMPLWLRIPLP
ncbi:MAG: endonuclease/exonuclease/phosphatase [Thermodesulfobacteriota bacterium]|nr:endonuclease/exonuclease/phosphatase [Thermodesulfobacteriota bacterium]